MQIYWIATTLLLGVQGAYYFVRDAVTPNLPPAFVHGDILWLSAFISTFVYRRLPYVTISLTAALLLYSIVILRSFSETQSITWLLASNSVLILALATAFLGSLHLRRKANPKQT